MKYLAIFLIILLNSCSSIDESKLPEAKSNEDQAIMVQSIDDPIEPFNRGAFAVNTFLFDYLLYPVTQGYNFVIPQAGREGVSRFYKNIKYPIRLTNNLLQGKWENSWTETKRFGINTTIGILGFSDAAKNDYGLVAKKEDLGQTFGEWGWDHNTYLFMPILGPGSGRDYLGRAGDSFLNPASYFPPSSIALGYNDFSLLAKQLNETLEREYDPYELTKVLYSLKREYEVKDYKYNPNRDNTGQVQTIRTIFAAPEDTDFLSKVEQGEAAVEGFRENIKYSFWDQGQPADLAIILPGLGGHRNGNSVLSLAEIAFNKGYNVISFSNTFNPEFLKAAPVDFTPGYIKEDSAKLMEAYTGIFEKLKEQHGNDYFKEKAVVGMSMGAWYSLNFAAQFVEDGTPDRLNKCIAINPPVNLFQSLKSLDNLYKAPLKGRSLEESKAIMNSALLKALASYENDLKPNRPMPFTDEEASYLIGLSFKFTLKEMIVAAEYGEKVGSTTARESVYSYLNSFTYEDYFEKFVIPQLAEKGIQKDVLLNDSNLHNRLDSLKKAKGTFLILSDNDFLLSDNDLETLKKSFPGKYKVYEGGGHLGNLWKADLKKLIADKLAQ